MTATSVNRLFDLSGRLALVTGSSKGIGLALARALGQAGARVVLNARDAARLEQARAELAAEGIDVQAVPFDVTDDKAVDAGIDAIESRIGAIDILVNNAGMQHRTPFPEFPVDAWRKIVATNVDSVFLVGRAVSQRMVARRRGRIINICSVQSELGRPGIAPYAATKGAVKMLTKGMAIDLGRHGIQVNGIGPGYFKTELNQALVDDPAFSDWLCKRTPMGRWGDVHELAGAAVFLASDAASFVSGHILYVDGGITSSL
jgi:gluconate 5-dehydrogenase